MTISTSYDLEHGLLIRRVEGAPSIEDFIEALDQTLHDPRFVKDMDAIWDFSGADLTLFKAHDINRLITQIHLRSEQRGSGYRIALVVSKKLVHHMARIFEAKGSTLPASIRILPSMTAAGRWLSDKTPAD